MARCDEGYLCEICGAPVDEMTESDLYLAYVIGELPAAALAIEPERHVRCNAVQAQFIVDEAFEPVTVEGPFDKRTLDPDDVARRESLVTRGWQRLQEVAGTGLPLQAMPLETSSVPTTAADTGLPPSAAEIPCRRPLP